jgi:hypothetical protein
MFSKPVLEKTRCKTESCCLWGFVESVHLRDEHAHRNDFQSAYFRQDTRPQRILEVLNLEDTTENFAPSRLRKRPGRRPRGASDKHLAEQIRLRQHRLNKSKHAGADAEYRAGASAISRMRAK